MDGKRLYLALLRKDARFDGKVFFGVTSTGIYCRPVCPARTPLRRNVLFYPTAHAAQKAGFRACRRCRPESRPGTPAWLGTSASVNRALRLIEGGFIENRGIAALADKLGMTERHLRRLFVQHLGASPRAIAADRRLRFARKLVEDSTLSISEVAFASGFESIRRFNDAFGKRFRRTPREIRQRRKT